MSSKVDVRLTKFKKLSSDEFRERFKDVFDLDVTLTPDKFYQILRDVKFEYGEAYLRVWDGVKNENEFLLPASRSPSPGPFSTPINRHISSVVDYSSTASRYKRSAPQLPIEDSDDELIFSIGSPERIRKRPTLSAFKTTSETSQNLVQGKSLCELSEDSDEDVRPMKKHRASTLPFRTTSTSITLESTSEQSTRDSGSKKKLQSKVAKSFEVASTLVSPPTPTPTNGNSSKSRAITAFAVEHSDTLQLDEDEEFDGNSEVSDSVENGVSRNNNTNTTEYSPRWQRGNQNDIVLKHRTKTQATPWLHKLGRRWFPTTLADAPVAGLKEIEVRNALDLKRYLEDIRKEAWEHETSKIEFIGPIIWQDNNDRLGYASVKIDGTTYRPGDCVIVRSTEAEVPKKKSNKTARSQQDENDRGPTHPWYARIVYLYKDEHGDEMAHFRWFQHGAETAMGEMAGPRELFLLTQCDDWSLACIYRKIQVSNKTHSDHSLQNGTGIVELNLLDEEEYFYRQHYHIGNEQFTDASMHETYDSGSQHSTQHCECCEELAEQSRIKQTRIIGATLDNGSNHKFEGFHRQGVDYYLHDFVYIFDDSFVPYRIGQIQRIYLSRASRCSMLSGPIANDKNLMIKVDLYDRYDKFYETYYEEFQAGRRPNTRDERRLYKSGKTTKILVDQVEGVCYVRHRKDIKDMERYKDDNDRFWVADKVADEIYPGGVIRRRDLTPLLLDEFKYSEKTEIDLAGKENRLRVFFKNHKKLRALDMFAGAGGLSIGMHMSGIVETLWAIEFSEAACKSLRKNLPNAKVYNVDGNILLERAVQLEKGEKLPPLLDCHGNVVPDLPRKGEVEFIFGGSPCPGFSRSNQYPKAEDIRNSLVVLHLSFLDFYRPKYFLLENVEAMLTYPLGATQVSVHKIKGGIERGMLKFILRALTSLGYQTQYTVLQAAEHNTPQSRTRAIFWASQLGYPLPAFPQPQNIVKSSRQWSKSWHRSRNAAPLPTCSVGDAITDLPPFDWMNPHRVIPQSRVQRLEREARWNNIAQYECEENAEFIGRDHQSYASDPVSEYQRKLRAGVRKDELFNHVTRHWDERTTMVTEQACNVPLRPGADHNDLPRALKHWSLTSPNSAASRNRNYPGRIGRMDMSDISGTCMTRLEPNSKNGKVLHPTQYRVITLREYARIMSFPDSYIFDLESMRVDDVVRQLGNAVPPNFADAIARPLRDVLIDKFEEERQLSESVKREGHSHVHVDVGRGQGSKDDPISVDSDDEFIEID